MEESARRRRTVLKTLILGAASILGLGHFLAPATPRKKILLTTPKAEVPSSGALVFREARVAVIRSGGEAYALDLACTHLGCTVTVTPGELVCPCHGSRFDRLGNVLSGPADRPLRRLPLEDHGESWVVLG